MTDGKGQVTRYTYDNLDRITQILYGDATSCSSSALCTSFVYDEDGNLLSRPDNTGTTKYSVSGDTLCTGPASLRCPDGQSD